ncbi:MAG TPA: ATP-binding cassette domain-containing protein [Candidatus Corynebacterium avicola]|uniref:ATP-binding cassette domain-containing protein n=1 Tax=Candidatus Corynebacterium avicola TaxID=2838527 RepID=A0A9D1RNU6_9CORY|nr:ATP-binding cassette domain-containing protein [Candidatus Corynebacterium avicola]
MNTPQSPSLICTELTKRFGSTTVIDNVSLALPAGQVTALVGPSGAGKTTLLNLLSGLEKPSRGTVSAPSRSERGFIFQDYNLLEAMTAADNALVSARLLGRRVPRRWVRELFDDLGLHGLERRLPHQLSGGQQQRVTIARVLLADVPYIFADEPTGALDPQSTEVVLTHLRQAADAGAVVVLVTHQDETLHIADRVLTVGGGAVREAAHVH